MRFLICVLAFLAAVPAPASAHIVLSQTRFETGQNFAAFFKVEHGCGESPTMALRVQIPETVTVLESPQKPGWALNAERSNGRVISVTWRGSLPAKQADQFGLLVKLPTTPGLLYFPTIQQCATGETRWTDIPATGQAWRDVPRPAPVVELIAAAPPTQFMAGDIMILQPWSPATPGGAATAAAYMTIMNHGSAPDRLLGGTSPASARLDIHQTSMANGVMTMRPAANGVTIPAGGMITLAPQDGYHLMLSGLKAPLTEGTRVPATLNFARAGAVQIEFTVAPIGARAPAAAEHLH